MSGSGEATEPGAWASDPTERLTVVTSTDRTPAPGLGSHAGRAPSGADDRGALRIADSVVEKVAVAAAGEVEHVGGVARRVLGIGGREAGDGRPRVSARVRGDSVALTLRLSVDYPASVRAVSTAAHDHVRDRVQALTELSVTCLDIDVAALVPAARGADARSRRVVE